MMTPRQLLSAVVLGAFALYIAACGGGGGGGAAVPAASNTITFTANLTLAQEVPTPTTPAGLTPSGSGTVTLDLATKVLTGSFTTTNVAGAGAAHLHDGDIGVAGPIAIPLQETPLGSGVWTVPAGTVLTDARIARLRAGGFYVNVHTALNAAGEIRGQLIPSGATSTAFTASLTLAQEEPTPATPAGLTPSGSGTVNLDPATRTLTGSFTTTNVAGAGAAHIHDGDIGVAGPIAIPLQETPLGSGVWTVPAGTVLTDARIALLRAGGLYVNVHTALNAGGEIRGQLIPSN